MQCDGQLGELRDPPCESTNVNEILSQDGSNDSEMCRKQLELAEEVLEEDSNYSEAKLNRAKLSSCDDHLKLEGCIDKSPRIDSIISKSPESKFKSGDQNSHDAQALDESASLPIDSSKPIATSPTLHNKLETNGLKRKKKPSTFYPQDSPDEISLADEDTKRPQRKQKPVSFYSNEGIENNFQSAKTASGKKQSKHSCFALLHGAHIGHKPCAVCFKHFKSPSFLSCNK